MLPFSFYIMLWSQYPPFTCSHTKLYTCSDISNIYRKARSDMHRPKPWCPSWKKLQQESKILLQALITFTDRVLGYLIFRMHTAIEGNETVSALVRFLNLVTILALAILPRSLYFTDVKYANTTTKHLLFTRLNKSINKY